MVKKRFRTKKSVVYLLRCPVTGLIRYVGETNNIFARFRQHLENTDPATTDKKRWILWLKEQGKQPILEMIQTFDDKEQGLICEKENIIKHAETVFNIYIDDQKKEPIEKYRQENNIELKPLFET